MNLNSYFPIAPFLIKTASRTKIINGLKRASIIDIYDYFLEMQTLATARNDFLFFSNQPAWKSAKSIIDLGCASGHYLNFLSSFFPQKKFIGVDINNDLLDLAKNRFTEAGTFICADISDFNVSKFDYIITRAVLQHLNNEQYSTFIKSLEILMKPSARLAFWDADPSAQYVCYPKIPSITNINNNLAKWQKKKGTNRFRLQIFIENCSYSAFEIEYHEKPKHIYINEFDKDIFVHFELSRAALISKIFDKPINLSTVAQELSIWLNTHNSYAITAYGQWVIVKKRT